MAGKREKSQPAIGDQFSDLMENFPRMWPATTTAGLPLNICEHLKQEFLRFSVNGSERNDTNVRSFHIHGTPKPSLKTNLLSEG